MDELDETVAWVRAHGPASLPLDGWDQASIWGWDETTGSLYAHLWRNTDDPGQPPAVRIEPGDYTPAITLLPTLAQRIAMAVDHRPWRVLTALEEAERQGDRDDATAANETGTVVTMTEGHGIWWPPNLGSESGRRA